MFFEKTVCNKLEGKVITNYTTQEERHTTEMNSHGSIVEHFLIDINFTFSQILLYNFSAFCFTIKYFVFVFFFY